MSESSRSSSVMEVDLSGSDTELEDFVVLSDVSSGSRSASTLSNDSDDIFSAGFVDSSEEGETNAEIMFSSTTASISSGSERNVNDEDAIIMSIINELPGRSQPTTTNPITSVTPPVVRTPPQANVSVIRYPTVVINRIDDQPTSNLTVIASSSQTRPIDNEPDPQIPSTSGTQRETSPKRQKLDPEDDGQMCSICFEPWTNSGDHCLVSLKCGHLFGHDCIEKWIKSTREKSRCPQCNAYAKKSEIRRIYARFLKVLDTSERDRALRDFEQEQGLRRKLEMEKTQVQLRYQMSQNECERLKKELIEHKEMIKQLRCNNTKNPTIQAAPSTTKSKFTLQVTVEISKSGGCRVMAASPYFPLLIVSQPSKNSLFSGFGIRKISSLDFRAADFIFLHQKEIKDIAFHPHDSLVLTASLDKTVKLTNVYSNSVVQTYNMPAEAWSCCWNKDDNQTFFVGLKSGKVLQLDTRKPTEKVVECASHENSPVLGVQYISKNSSAPISMNGVLALQFVTCNFFESRGARDFKCHTLPIEGRFTSLSIEPITSHALISTRPSTKQPKTKHMLCELTYQSVSSDMSVVDNACSCNVIQTLEGGHSQAQITRSKVFLNPGNETSALICAGDETARAALVWDVNSRNCIDQLKADSPILDVCNFRSNRDFCLSTLTKDAMRVYKWNN